MAGGGALSYLTVEPPRALSYGPPPVSSDWIGKLPEDFQQGQQYGYQRNLQTMFQPGTPGAAALQQQGIQPGSLAGLLAGATGAQFAAPYAQRQLQGQIYQQLMGGGGGPPAGDQQSALPTGGADPRGMMPTVLDAAKINNIDPRRFAAVAHGEGLANYHGDYENGKPTSFGAMQLHFGGRTKGLGDEYYAETGKDPRDPANEKDMIYFAGRKIREGGWGPWTAARKLGFGKWDGIGQQPAASTQTAAATPQSDQLTPANRAALNASYQSRPIDQQPAAAVGTSPVAAPDEEAQPAAVEQPEGSTGQHPFIAPQGNAAGPGNIVKGAAQPPQQVAQAAPAAAAPLSNDVLTRYTQAADSLQRQAAETRDTVRRQGLAAAGSGLTIPPESMKAQLDQADKQDAQAAEYRKIVNEQRSKQLGIPIEEQTKAAGAAGEAKGKRVGEVIEAGGNARNTMNDLNTIEDAVRQGGDNINYGPGAEFWQKAKQTLNNYFPQSGVAEADTIQKMNARLAAAAAKSMTARPSQLEFKTFVANNPGIMNSKEGTIALINILKQTAQHDIELGRLANRTNPNDWPDTEDRYYDEHPLRSPFTSKPLTPPALPQAKMTGPEFAAWGQSMGLAPGDPIKVNGKLKHFVPPQ